MELLFVTPAEAGVPKAAAALGWHTGSRQGHDWIPAFRLRPHCRALATAGQVAEMTRRKSPFRRFEEDRRRGPAFTRQGDLIL